MRAVPGPPVQAGPPRVLTRPRDGSLAVPALAASAARAALFTERPLHRRPPPPLPVPVTSVPVLTSASWCVFLTVRLRFLLSEEQLVRCSLQYASIPCARRAGLPAKASGRSGASDGITGGVSCFWTPGGSALRPAVGPECGVTPPRKGAPFGSGGRRRRLPGEGRVGGGAGALQARARCSLAVALWAGATRPEPPTCVLSPDHS